ncbi:Lipase 3 [Cytospora mali]|uniref:Lipase 3 n=1 Tax=Cytospora mali TaxID=578113 RepID=A0A194UMA9_CYTMA|nr:Lipase 3 [Valsa mali var. pyri (nom. inval.)]
MSGNQETLVDSHLPHLSINPEKQPTILLIHGAFDTKNTWDPIHPYLSEYHFLIPTLPGHDDSSTSPVIGELTLQTTSERLYQLVTAKAHNGQTHVVGHSFGANIALHFISHYTDQILSVFVSGTAGFYPSSMTPYGLWIDGILSYAMPRRLVEYLIDVDPRLWETSSFGNFRSLELCKAISNILMIPVEDEVLIPAVAQEELKKRQVRAIAVAATKKGVLPTNDNVERAKAVAQRLGGIAAEVPTMRHAFVIQDPELFARIVAAWIEGEVLPEGMHPSVKLILSGVSSWGVLRNQRNTYSPESWWHLRQPDHLFLDGFCW